MFEALALASCKICGVYCFKYNRRCCLWISGKQDPVEIAVSLVPGYVHQDTPWQPRTP